MLGEICLVHHLIFNAYISAWHKVVLIKYLLNKYKKNGVQETLGADDSK